MKVNFVRLVFLAVLAALVMSGCAITQEKKMSAEDLALCAALDKDGDRRITKEEFMARVTDKNKGLKVFEKCDLDRKGYLTYDEIRTRRMMLPPELMIYTAPVLRPVR